MKQHLIILGIEQLERNNLIIDQKIKEIKQKNKVRRLKLKKKNATLEQETTLGQEIYKLKEDNKEVDLSYIPKEYTSYLDLFKKNGKRQHSLATTQAIESRNQSRRRQGSTIWANLPNVERRT